MMTFRVLWALAILFGLGLSPQVASSSPGAYMGWSAQPRACARGIPHQAPDSNGPETRIGGPAQPGGVRGGGAGTATQTSIVGYGSNERELAAEQAFGLFNFEVQNDHSFFVGKSQLLVHNECPITDPRRLLTGLAPVEIEFPAKGLSNQKQKLFSAHLAQQEVRLNSMPAEELERNLINYRYLSESGALAQARALARQYLPGIKKGKHAAHLLDARAGGHIHEFAGMYDAVQSYIGSLWRERWKLIVPGRTHKLIPKFK